MWEVKANGYWSTWFNFNTHLVPVDQRRRRFIIPLDNSKIDMHLVLFDRSVKNYLLLTRFYIFNSLYELLTLNSQGDAVMMIDKYYGETDSWMVCINRDGTRKVTEGTTWCNILLSHVILWTIKLKLWVPLLWQLSLDLTADDSMYR
jgi:hypothetical protein